MEYEDVWYESDDGLRLYSRDYRNENAPLTLLCMHGLTRNSADFEVLAAQFHEQYRVVVPDQRGRGRSQWDHNADRYVPATYVGDMFTLIEHLSLNNVVLVGTSMGGLMAMVMNMLRPDCAIATVLNDVGPEINPAGLDRIKSYVGKSEPIANWNEAVEQVSRVNDVAFPDYQRQDWENFARRLYQENADGHLVLKYDPAISQPMNASDDNAVPASAWPAFETMTNKPLLCLRGALSDILDPGCVVEMQRMHPEMSVVEIPNVGHAPMLDESEAVTAIEAFLSELL